MVPGRLSKILLIALVAIAPEMAEARPKAPPGHVVYVQKGAVWRAPLADPKKPVKLMAVPALRRRFTRLEAAGDGSALLVELGRNAAWIDLSVEPPAPPVYLPCRGRARLSPTGERVMCASRTAKGTAIYRMRPSLGGAALLAGVDPAGTNLSDLSGEHLVMVDKGGLWSVPVAQPDQRTQVSPHVPAGGLSIAPDGQRAVGRYGEENAAPTRGRRKAGVEAGESLFGFRLDGQAARRKLGPGTPVGWSADSVWIAVASDNTACAVKAVGGEYKCWDRFRALAINRDGSWLLMAKPPGARGRRLDLFLGRVGGPHAERPLPLLLRGVSAAVLVP